MSFSNLHSRYSILYQSVRYLKRKFVKKELEKINDLKIIYAGSKQFLPKNYYKKFNWLIGKQLVNYAKKSKFIVCADNLTRDLNERLYFSKYGCLPLIQEDYLKKTFLSQLTFDKRNKLSNLILNLKKKNKSFVYQLSKKILNLHNKGYVSNPYDYYLKKVKNK